MQLQRLTCALCLMTGGVSAFAQITPQQREHLTVKLEELSDAAAQLPADIRPEDRADIEVCLKAARWALRHDEFPKKDYIGQTEKVLSLAATRIERVKSGQSPDGSDHTSIRGYRSRVDDSYQPYAVSFPANFDPDSTRSLPLHLKLHGRANAMNEVNFFHRHQGRRPAETQYWIQLDVYGRGNNAYRWAGETDVFEALADVLRRYRIDEQRITLHGFSMGGAGAWHLGMHHPHRWSSVGAGAGFVDFYKYQKQIKQRPPHQHLTLGIYDAVDYALNAFNVPVVAYGGEKDAQLLAARSMTDAAARQDVDIKLLIGPGMGHKFDPDSLAQFMAFHDEHTQSGRPRFGQRKHIRFTTRTLKYNTCDWLSIEEVGRPYAETTVDALIDDTGTLQITTTNVTVLRLARGIASRVEIDGTELPFESAADGLLPDVYYSRGASGQWSVLDYQTSKAFPNNSALHKRHNLQGPIDDAFMEAFVCVKPTGTPTSDAHHEWAMWTLDRFAMEWDQWMRGELPVVPDTAVTDELARQKHLILFGDPTTNLVIRRIVDQLPLKWDKDSITVRGTDHSTDSHGLAMVFPNPLNPKRYVVINSGHTFHERDFRASNSWLFPRLGDGAVIRFTKRDKQAGSGFAEETVDAWICDQAWQIPGTK